MSDGVVELARDPDGESRIRGKVAEVVSDREVILNRGAEHGVRAGMYFAILDPGAVGITDPDTNEPLGDIKVVKIVVRAIEVAPRITLARTFRTRRVNVGGTGALGMRNIVAAMQEPEYVDKVEKLTLDKNSPRKIDPKDSVVGRGDPFESAEPEEVEDVRSITVWEEPTY
ncbi:hypothetical protein [Curtobacterium sp. VKM Ac-2884]|uniref:hypothetical protein n=1 Tax=Curtobacterium sp. VKM Ac-2884 TaxID=2783818 RepID=UPI00188C49C3|nr:hypothetical protein [Curtobacterium sp. VKM Ac-2884]MBF4604703.1 hypothetical protein [Curtobacterium sp. VKM Ac-2884]